MSITEPIDDGNLTDNLICLRCNTSMPPHAVFCSSCGETIKKKKNEEEGRTQNGEDAAQGQELDETVRLPPLSRAHLKGLQSYRFFKNNGTTGWTYKSSSPPQNSEAPAFKDVVGTKEISDEAPQLSKDSSAVTGATSDRWGWFPALSLTSAVGVFLVALADNAGRVSLPWAEVLWWFGLVALFLPIAWRLFLRRPARRERIALLVMLGMALYLVKYLQYPLYFTYFDEFLNLRTVSDIAASGYLFQRNPLTPIIPYYPGLEIVTNALSNLTGLPLFPTGIVLLGVVRLLCVLILYLFYEHVSNSQQVAGIATLLYIANPGFLYQDSEFSYESLALPLAIFVVLAVARYCDTPAGRRKGLTIAICLGLGAVVISHHLTSYALVLFLLFWTAIWLLPQVKAFFHRRRAQQDQGSPGGVALLGLVLCVLWLKYTGDAAVGYAGPYFDNATRQLVQILAGEGSTRQLFQSGPGSVLPLWEQVTTLASVGLILLGLPFGLLQILRYHRAKATMLALAGVALAYPASLAVRLTPAGGELANRSSEFVFLGVAFALAIGATEFWLSRAPNWRRSAMIIGVVGVIFVGQVLTGNGQTWARLPGPYLVVADDRSIEPEGIAAAEWAGSYLGPGHRIATDRINLLLMGTYGNEWPVVFSNSVASVFTSLQFGSAEKFALRQYRIQYLVVDHRLSTRAPQLGVYFITAGSTRVHYTRPIDPAALAKFDNVQNVNRVFDSGDIVIYNVEAITNGPSTAPPCVPAPPTTVSSAPMLAAAYTGIIFSLSNNQSIGISLTGIQQQRGSICGTFTGLSGTAPFRGSIAPDGHIQIQIMNRAGQGPLTFDGSVQPDGTLAGNFCRPKAGRCSDYGLWSLSPAT